MATVRIERNTGRDIPNLVDAIDVRAIDCGTWGFHRLQLSSTFGAMAIPSTQPYGHASMYRSAYCLLHKRMPAGHHSPWLGDSAKAERRAILQRY